MRATIIAAVAVLAIACTKKEAEREPTAQAVAGPDIRSEEVTYQAGDRTLVGYLAWDARKEGPRPGVLVVHQWWGHSDYVRKRADMLAELGYTALALDMYGKGRYATHPDDAMKFMNETISNMDVAKERFAAAYEVLQKHGTTNPDDIAAIGYCYGGAVVLHMARFGVDLDGVASFHGMLATEAPAQKGAVKGKILVLHGEADPMVPPEQVEGFKKEMDAAEVDFSFIAYPGAKHAFTDEEATAKGQKFEMPLEYNAEADEKSWAALVEFLSEVFPTG